MGLTGRTGEQTQRPEADEAVLQGQHYVLRVEHREAYLRPVLCKQADGRYPAKPQLEALHNEWAILHRLQPIPGVRPALAMEGTEGQPVLVMEYIEGQTLRELLQRSSWGLQRKLEIARDVAAILDEIHQQRVIHRDVNSANILVGSDDTVYLIDFGIATLQGAGETALLAHHDTAVGTLAYTSPEQTGHLDRVVDQRADLYSSGVVLYELLTGRLPFQADDALAMIHCHLARKPLPPHEVDPTLPVVLSNVVLKLLAKEPSDRYQSAQGLQADLARCLTDLQTTGGIEPFELAHDDRPPGLRIADKLYGRDAEVQRLEQALAQLNEGGVALVLVAGHAGVGKTALVHELRNSATARGGRFVEGKFDQFGRAIPYHAWAQALGQLVEAWLAEGEANLARRRAAILEAVGPNGQLLIDLVPGLERVIGPQPSVQILGGQEARNRFGFVFGQFVKAVVSAEAPLVIFLDDLQWIDGGSLDLLDAMAAEQQLRGLLVIGAYRDNEVDTSHPLTLALEAMRRESRPIATLTLHDLQQAHIEELVTDALGAAAGKPLARWLHRQTHGNPFFARRFLRWMEEKETLHFDRSAQAWTWDSQAVQLTAVADNVADLLAGEIGQLPADTAALLELAAFVGNEFDIATLAVVSEQSEAVVSRQLAPAIAAHLLNTSGAQIAFMHDRVQQAAYALADQREQQQTHLRVGRLLLAADPKDRTQPRFFAVVDHFNSGEALLRPGKQRTKLARLNLEAGILARDAGAFVTAADYFQAGLRCLPKNGWRAHHALAFELHKRAAEAAFVNRQVGASEELIDQALAHTDDAAQRADLYTIRIAQLTMQARYAEAKQAGRQALELLGAPLPQQDLPAVLAELLQRLSNQLGKRPIGYLLEAPEVQRPEIRAAARVVASMVPACFFTDDMLWTVGVAQATLFALEHGAAVEFAYPLVGVSLVLSAMTGQHELGFEFGETAQRLCEKYGDRLQAAKVAEPFACHVFAWARPVREAEPLIRDGYQAALESGEVAYAGYMLSTRLSNMLYWVDDLGELQQAVETSLAYNRKTENALGFYLASAYQFFLRRMGRQTAELISFDGVVLDEASFIEICESQQIEFALCEFYVLRARARYLQGEMAAALTDLDQARARIAAITGMLSNADLNLFHSLALCATCRALPQAQREPYLQQLEANQQLLESWAASCPENFEGRYLLVQAELARLAGQNWEAMELYDRATRSARDNAFIQLEALANQLAGRFWLGHGKQQLAAHSLAKSCRLYKRWGAETPAAEMRARHRELLRSVDEPSRGPRTVVHTQQIRDILNVTSIAKASRDIASEVLVDRVISAVLDVAIENAGAQRALLLMPNEDDWAIVARVDVDDDHQPSAQRLELAHSTLVLESIVRYAIRTGQPVVLEDAGQDDRFRHDPTLQRRPTKSVVCVPLVDRERLRGIIYLENNLLRGAFTAERVELLRLLSTQMAISLESAQIRQNLAQVAERFVATFEQAAVGIAHVAVDGRFLLVNQRFCDIVGYTRDEMLQRTVQDITHADDLEADLANAKRLYDGDIDTYSIDKRYYRSSGEIVWVRLTVSLLRAQDGRPDLYIGVIEDITEQKEAEDQLRSQAVRLQLATAATRIGLWEFNPVTQEVYFSEEWKRQLGYADHELENRYEEWNSRLHPDDRARTIEGLHAYLAGRTSDYTLEFRLRHKDGSYRWIYTRADKQVDEAGNPTRLYGCHVDLTARKDTELALKESEARYRTLFEHAGVGIAISDARTRRIKYANPEFCRMLGYTREELAQLRIDDLHPEDMVEQETVPLFERARRQRVEMTNYPFVTKTAAPSTPTGSRRRSTSKAKSMWSDSSETARTGSWRRTDSRLYQRRLKSLASQLTIAEERERRRIATELHDTVSQSLALARVQIATVRGSSADDDVNEMLGGLSSSLLQAIKVTRQIMSDLSPPQISELGLSAAISEWLDDEIGAKHGLETAYQATGDEPELSDDLRALLFRNVRELLANVVKHAQAHRVSIVLRNTQDEVLISVEDDGIGFDPAQAASFKPTDEGGFGLFSIQERMADLGGELHIDSRPGKGTAAMLRLPGISRGDVPSRGPGRIAG